MKGIIFLLIIAVVVLAGCSAQGNTNANVVKSDAQEDSVKELRIDSYNWDFKTNDVEINKGDRVRLILTSSSGTHGISIPGLGIDVPPVSPGQEQVVEFVAKESGNFEYYCNIMCGPGHREMRSSITIN